jgi:hypothetical protein
MTAEATSREQIKVVIAAPIQKSGGHECPPSKLHGSPNANTFFEPLVKVPLPQNTMPSEIDAPALHGAPVS